MCGAVSYPGSVVAAEFSSGHHGEWGPTDDACDRKELLADRRNHHELKVMITMFETRFSLGGSNCDLREASIGRDLHPAGRGHGALS